MNTTAQEDILSYNSESLLSALLDLSEAMLECGADVNLVEDYLQRIGFRYGASRMNVFVITSSIVVTMTRGGRDVTQTRRVVSEVGNNFSRLERLNELARTCLNHPMPPERIVDGVRELINSKASFAQTCAAGCIATGTLAVFFGGHAVDGAVAAFLAVFICLAQRHLQRYCPNLIAFNYLAATVIGVVTLGICTLFPVLNMDKILIGDIMLLIPGIALTNSMRDMLSGDTLAGILRLMESLIWASALALGYATALLLASENAPSILEVAVNNCPREVQVVLAAIASGAFTVFFNAERHYVLPAAMGGFMSWAIYLWAGSLGCGIWVAVFAASVAAAVYARLLSILTKAPLAIFFILAEVPLIPGGSLYYSASSVAWGQTEAAAHFASLTGETALGISFGIGVVWMAVKVFRRIVGRDESRTLADALRR